MLEATETSQCLPGALQHHYDKIASAELRAWFKLDKFNDVCSGGMLKYPRLDFS
jgi:hypothetical protein